jgi:hypothetical protein
MYLLIQTISLKTIIPAYSRFICVKIICIEKVKLLDQCQGTAKKKKRGDNGMFRKGETARCGGQKGLAVSQ